MALLNEVLLTHCCGLCARKKYEFSMKKHTELVLKMRARVVLRNPAFATNSVKPVFQNAPFTLLLQSDNYAKIPRSVTNESQITPG